MRSARRGACSQGRLEASNERGGGGSVNGILSSSPDRMITEEASTIYTSNTVITILLADCV